ncbi:MAG: D-alanyl-D-alanine carboxypeptidase, partial [Candidatus Kerfeldbacteria bacterium]|nr:D-alanyl-D-alanine carboxypeptidase [Candidatus Kerfeldbacteria bacterium]
SLQTATKAWVRTVKTPPALPAELIALSPVYSFTIQDETDWLDTPLQFQYHLKGKKYKYDRSYYYYDTATESWLALDSTLNRSDRTISTEWGALHALVVVAADTTDPFGPSQTSDFTAFGGINAAAAIAIDEATGDVLYSYNMNTERSMASMTKMMTAYVLFQNDIDLDAVATYHDRYDQAGGSLHVSEGETMTMGNLMNALLVGSANNAAYALVGNAGYSVSEFVSMMNDTAVELGLDQTTFADPSGLAVGNITTASDYAKLMKAVLQTDTIADISSTPYYAFTTINYANFHDFNNTNSLLLTSSLDITGSKTGYIDEALYCLAMRTEEDGHSIITVVMGAPTLSARTNESYRLVNWVFDNYQW